MPWQLATIIFAAEKEVTCGLSCLPLLVLPLPVR